MPLHLIEMIRILQEHVSWENIEGEYWSYCSVVDYIGRVSTFIMKNPE